MEDPQAFVSGFGTQALRIFGDIFMLVIICRVLLQWQYIVLDKFTHFQARISYFGQKCKFMSFSI